jgi:hypothetical protein
MKINNLTNEALMEQIKPMLKDEDSNVRSSACYELVEIVKTDSSLAKECFELIESLINDQEVFIRRKVRPSCLAEILKIMQPEHGFKLIEKHFDNESDYSKLYLLNVLEDMVISDFSLAHQVFSIIKPILESDCREHKAIAIKILPKTVKADSSLASKSLDIIEYMLKQISWEGAFLQYEAIIALGEIGEIVGHDKNIKTKAFSIIKKLAPTDVWVSNDRNPHEYQKQRYAKEALKKYN